MTNPRRDKFWLLAALLFGLLALPFLVHLTGVFVLGKYAGGGAVAFLGDYLRGLVTLQWFSWVLALGPLVIVASWRMLFRLGSATRARHPVSGMPQAAVREVRPTGRGNELELSVEGSPNKAATPKAPAGLQDFDPYSSDAGFAKPHGWDDVSHK